MHWKYVLAACTGISMPSVGCTDLFVRIERPEPVQGRTVVDGAALWKGLFCCSIFHGYGTAPFKPSKASFYGNKALLISRKISRCGY